MRDQSETGFCNVKEGHIKDRLDDERAVGQLGHSLCFDVDRVERDAGTFTVEPDTEAVSWEVPLNVIDLKVVRLVLEGCVGEFKSLKTT